MAVQAVLTGDIVNSTKLTAASIWLTKLILAHLITDFILQPKK